MFLFSCINICLPPYIKLIIAQIKKIITKYAKNNLRKYQEVNQRLERFKRNKNTKTSIKPITTRKTTTNI
ncbi:hypothetical protein [Methanobrevibacter oralis]|uniref:hypothetical protein n=1 Tax=Methanobrevibacter oralis TaxID=66851 RepID=UPI0005B2DF3E|nr:hypothetical protein [Methanobrevibacter oralis]